MDFETHAEVMARYRSSPAVSQIWALMVKLLSCTVRVLNSTPMVVRVSWLNSFLVKRDSRLLFPTPDSPIRTTADDKWSKCEYFDQSSVFFWFSCCKTKPSISWIKETKLIFTEFNMSQSCDVHFILCDLLNIGVPFFVAPQILCLSCLS